MEDLVEWAQKAQKTLNDLLATLSVIEKRKDDILAQYKIASQEQKVEMQKQIEESEREYVLLNDCMKSLLKMIKDKKKSK